MSIPLRFALVAVLLTGAAGCRNAQPGRLPDDRDYRSINRSSVAFLKETVSEGNAIRAQSWKATVDFAPRWEENLRRQREGRRFAGETFMKDEAQNWNRMIAGVGEELSFDPAAWAASARFGFLDSGS